MKGLLQYFQQGKNIDFSNSRKKIPSTPANGGFELGILDIWNNIKMSNLWRENIFPTNSDNKGDPLRLLAVITGRGRGSKDYRDLLLRHKMSLVHGKSFSWFHQRSNLTDFGVRTSRNTVM